jgi:hypothetical protein
MPENSLVVPERAPVGETLAGLPDGRGESSDAATATLILALNSLAALIADLGAYKPER